MFHRALGLSFLSFALFAADKKLPIEQNSNELVEISATVTLDKDQIKQELGSDFGGDIVLVRVTVRPVSDKPIKVSLDDFLLVSGKDGQRAEPYTPSQIAGTDVLVVTRTEPKKKGGFGVGLGPIMSGVGPGGADNTKTETKAEKGDSDKPNPLLETLKEKVLKEKEITEPISGFLYFQVVGKVKPKDLELHYKGPGGRLALRFHP
ncbi:MAG TPA: hypothetical protein VGP62_03210 [Bryobacteraceae bacterium]|jgi:hypothetical protein|nr:hypothetical protein [Bryobacteraceae bacterium]